ncbi:unnamed protein product [Owenia fusiformis]|uniref:Uncharacterized protein n=1 Tax=Owenia fusiformis TaxID=6347 RepID=A0A8J1TL29_OWEFU|nr:unnamed protein product [Owenia fusiformis]
MVATSDLIIIITLVILVIIIFFILPIDFLLWVKRTKGTLQWKREEKAERIERAERLGPRPGMYTARFLLHKMNSRDQIDLMESMRDSPSYSRMAAHMLFNEENYEIPKIVTGHVEVNNSAIVNYMKGLKKGEDKNSTVSMSEHGDIMPEIEGPIESRPSSSTFVISDRI